MANEFNAIFLLWAKRLFIIQRRDISSVIIHHPVQRANPQPSKIFSSSDALKRNRTNKNKVFILFECHYLFIF